MDLITNIFLKIEVNYFSFFFNLVLAQFSFPFFLNFFRIRRLGYPIRHAYAEFVDRYYLLVKGMKAKEANPKEATNVIANLILPKEDWQLGKTKIFLKVIWIFQFF